MRHGTGRMDYPDGSYYTGSWVQDKRHGEGVLSFGQGGRFEGSRREDATSNGCIHSHLSGNEPGWRIAIDDVGSEGCETLDDTEGYISSEDPEEDGSEQPVACGCWGAQAQRVKSLIQHSLNRRRFGDET